MCENTMEAKKETENKPKPSRLDSVVSRLCWTTVTD